MGGSYPTSLPKPQISLRFWGVTPQPSNQFWVWVCSPSSPPSSSPGSDFFFHLFFFVKKKKVLFLLFF